MAAAVLSGCGGAGDIGRSGPDSGSPALVRAERRAFDGAPPVVPHDNFAMTCTTCHHEDGVTVPGVGFAPPSPHEDTIGMSAISRCQQCHVFSAATGVFAASRFEGLRPDVRRGSRFATGAPPTIPHQIFMREHCLACHSGPAAREEIRTTHPERARCRQCHVPVAAADLFAP